MDTVDLILDRCEKMSRHIEKSIKYRLTFAHCQNQPPSDAENQDDKKIQLPTN